MSSLRVALSNLPNLLVSVSPDAGVYDPVGVAFAPDERRVVIVDKQAGARVLDLESGQTVLELANDGKPLVSAAFSLDGAILDVLDADENTVVYESASGRRITAIHARAMIVKIRFWPSGRFIVAGSRAVSKDAVRPTSSYGAGIAAIRSSPILLSKKIVLTPR